MDYEAIKNELVERIDPDLQVNVITALKDGKERTAFAVGKEGDNVGTVLYPDYMSVDEMVSWIKDEQAIDREKRRIRTIIEKLRDWDTAKDVIRIRIEPKSDIHDVVIGKCFHDLHASAVAFVDGLTTRIPKEALESWKVTEAEVMQVAQENTNKIGFHVENMLFGFPLIKVIMGDDGVFGAASLLTTGVLRKVATDMMHVNRLALMVENDDMLVAIGIDDNDNGKFLSYEKTKEFFADKLEGLSDNIFVYSVEDDSITVM